MKQAFLLILTAVAATWITATVLDRTYEEGAPHLGWEVLAGVNYGEVEVAGRTHWGPTFDERVTALEGDSVTISGYMIPLDFADEQSEFLISEFPGDGCFFHMPGGPRSVVEVQASTPAEFSYDVVAVQGRLQLLENDPYGMLYRLVDAKPVER